jgi:DNA-directed RNA polymerase specialized sigma24 family protein
MAEQGEISAADELLIVELYPSLRRWAAVVSPDDDPNDLVQEAVVRTLRARSLASIPQPGAYLRKVIVNLVKNERRRRSRERRARSRMAPESEMVPFYPSDLADLRRLSAFDRALLYLVVVERASYAEAALVLKCRESTARTRAHRALRQLRATLSEEVET